MNPIQLPVSIIFFSVLLSMMLWGTTPKTSYTKHFDVATFDARASGHDTLPNALDFLSHTSLSAEVP